MRTYFLTLIFSLGCLLSTAQSIDTDVLIIGGGASGTMAGIQSARMDASTIIIEETPWLGGMLTSAGVSAVDGNYRLHSGLWEEFRQRLNTHYGGEENLKTGWVSNVLFEPHIAQLILTDMVAKEKKLSAYRESTVERIQKKEKGWKVDIKAKNGSFTVNAKIVIDATELGDIARKVGIPYDVGMDSRYETGEAIAPEKANSIVQDLTYVAILKDYGPSADKTIAKPDNYDPAPFFCTCAGKCDPEDLGRTLWPCDKMMDYGKLPNNYYMINWPIYGNDYYLNLIELLPQERKVALERAKNFTLQYIYYLQTELGYKHLGIADDIYPTSDGLPLIPYHRESRRIKGLVRFTVNDLARPFQQETQLYRTGIAVGDYPVDHHHAAYPEAEKLPDLHFYPVPSYSLPLGTLIPKNTKDFIVAEKSISVTNLVNGTTRLQPVCLLIGQASGALAALAVKNKLSPAEVPVRLVQTELLNAGAFLMPYSDVPVNSKAFKAIQRIGATGILNGEGKNIGWENHTHFYPDSVLTAPALREGLKDWLPAEELEFSSHEITFKQAREIIEKMARKFRVAAKTQHADHLAEVLESKGIALPKANETISRATFSVLLDELLDPFLLRNVNHFGKFYDN